MHWLLNTAYLLVLLLASPWLVWQAARKGKYREGFAAKLWGRVPLREGGRPCLWLHAVSVGEINLLAPLLSEIERRHRDWQCVISTTTAAGYALAQRKYAGRLVFHCPLDFSWAVREAVARIRPDVLVLAELELWPNLIGAAQNSGARVAIINGRLSDRSFHGYRRVKLLLAPVLARLDLVIAQTRQYHDRFIALGARPDRVHVAGSLKFDGAETDRNNARTRDLSRLAGITDGDIVLLAGSTQDPEEVMVLDIYRRLLRSHPRLRFILVPRHPERFESVGRMLTSSGVTWERRSDLDSRPHNPEARVLLVDRVGELGAWWGAAQLGFVGGSIGTRGGQNMIEPAAYGAATCFGPNTQNFRETVKLLLEHEAAHVVCGADDMAAFFGRCLADASYAERMGARARHLIASQLGATRRTVDLLEPLIRPVASKATQSYAA